MNLKECFRSAKRYIEKEADFFSRYQLLKNTYRFQKNFPSFFDFYPKTLPFRNKEGNLVFEKALSIKRSCGERLWVESTKKLTLEEKENYQVVIIPNRHEHDGNTDFSKLFEEKLINNPLEKHPIAKFVRGIRYHNDPNEYERKVENMKNVKSVYIVASLIDDTDFLEVADVASQYINNGAKEVNLIAPFYR